MSSSMMNTMIMLVKSIPREKLADMVLRQSVMILTLNTSEISSMTSLRVLVSLKAILRLVVGAEIQEGKWKYEGEWKAGKRHGKLIYFNRR